MKHRFFKEWQTLTAALPAKHFVLAISGGVDSVVLARLLADIGVSFSLAHCNFKLRGLASDEDEAFVSDLAEELGVRLAVETFATEDYARDNGVSIQMAARELRYQWFDRLTANENTWLVTAHHADDVAETMLFNLSKGTGLPGLHGIRPIDQKKLRPLLWATKEEILQYARENQIVWREDYSNNETKYSRNRIRHKVIPELTAINPAFVTAVRRTAERLADAEALIDFYVESLKLTRQEGRHLYINKEKLVALPGMRTVLYRLLGMYGFNYDQVEAISRAFDSVGATFVTSSAELNVDRKELILSAIGGTADAVTITDDCRSFKFGDRHFACRVVDRKDYRISADEQVAALDWHKLNFPLIVRSYKTGDRFQPLGMAGKKLISDFLIDSKVPVNHKKEQAVVVSDNEVVWLVGRRIDDRYKITEHTKQVLEIRPGQALE